MKKEREQLTLKNSMMKDYEEGEKMANIIDS